MKGTLFIFGVLQVASHFNPQGTVSTNPTFRGKMKQTDERDGETDEREWTIIHHPLIYWNSGKGEVFKTTFRLTFTSHRKGGRLMICLKASSLLLGGNRKQWGKQAQPGVHAAWGSEMGTESQSQPAWHSERCERCPSLPLMHPGVVDWFFAQKRVS